MNNDLSKNNKTRKNKKNKDKKKKKKKTKDFGVGGVKLDSMSGSNTKYILLGALIFLVVAGVTYFLFNT